RAPPRLPLLAYALAGSGSLVPSTILLRPASFLYRPIRRFVRLPPRDRGLYVVRTIEVAREVLDQVIRLSVRQLALFSGLRLHLAVLGDGLVGRFALLGTHQLVHHHLVRVIGDAEHVADHLLDLLQLGLRADPA